MTLEEMTEYIMRRACALGIMQQAAEEGYHYLSRCAWRMREGRGDFKNSTTL